MSSQFSIQASFSNSAVYKSPANAADGKPADTESGNTLPAATNDKKAEVHATDPSQLSDVLKKIESDIQQTRREIKFEVREELGTPVVSVLDLDTKEVIRQFPPEEVLAMAERVAELGDEKGGKLFRSIV